MKDIILNNITMLDILNKYNISYNKTMFHCPFHKDKHASAKFYDNSFYCFSCNKTGDVIQFVQYLYNLDFKQTMRKINIDFNLGLESNTKIDKNKILEIERKRKEKELTKKRKLEKYIKLSDEYRELKYEIDRQLELANILNWEDKVYKISKLQNKLGIIEEELNYIDNLLMGA